MKAVILAGGLGTRISEETDLKPKPMIAIGGKPILWHIMKIYSHHGINEFIICCGYKGYVIKEYFANYFLHMSDITFEMSDNRMVVHHQKAEPWKVTMVDTGENTMTGGRLKRVADNVNITELIAFHKAHQVKGTLTSVIPPGRFGVLDIQGDKVRSFQEKPQGDGTKINGGFFVLSPKVIEYMQDDQTILEKGPLERLAKEGSLAAYQHKGFWQPMDTLRDKMHLEELWQSGKAPWKVWQ